MDDDELARVFAAPLTGRVIGHDGAELVLAEWRDPGGGDDPPRYIAPLHVHHLDDEAWYVLEGELAVRLGDRDVAVPAGGAVLVPRGIAHTYWNPSPGPTRYLLAMSARLAALISVLHELESPDEATVAAAFEAFGSAYLGWP